MRRIGQVDNKEQAGRLIDYLLTKQIEARALDGDDGVEVWALEEDRVPQGREELKAFKKAPEDPRYAAAADAARQTREEELTKQIAHRKRQVQVRRRWDRPLPAGRHPARRSPGRG